MNEDRKRQIYSLLKKSLLKAPKEFPARGPIGKPVIEGDLQYENFSDKCDISNPDGEEIISLLNEEGKRSKVLYELEYKGQFFDGFIGSEIILSSVSRKTQIIGSKLSYQVRRF